MSEKDSYGNTLVVSLVDGRLDIYGDQGEIVSLSAEAVAMAHFAFQNYKRRARYGHTEVKATYVSDASELARQGKPKTYRKTRPVEGGF